MHIAAGDAQLYVERSGDGPERCPTPIVSGDGDTALVTGGPRRLEGVHELHRLIPHSELVIVPGANHYVQLEQPEAS